LKRYWTLYGGWRALFRSPYLYAALLLSFACYPLWLQTTNSNWADISINILPSLMGFAVAGMAIMLAFSHPESLDAVTQKGREDSYFLKTIANLSHFLISQVVALLVAVIGHEVHNCVLAYVGVLTLLYALLTSVAAAGQLFNTARIMNTAAWLAKTRGKKNEEGKPRE
jgi:hypothetical protein